MKKILLSILCVSLYACQESKPAEPEVTQEEQEQKMAAERFEALGKDLDENPSFKECEDIATKDEKLKCFTGNLSKLYQEMLNSQKLAIGDALSDTVKVTLLINNEGIISVKEVEMSEKTKELLPSLGELLMSETENFPPIIPAKKNQVNVSSEFVLPLVIDVK
ncbi:hypothetical protein [Capnocytophaga gingivalis]|jgi:hypothetical protein|uniref:hypothetical protein n=2 Tax=Capnocytophaga gingivalis TaxID=1017 RepID=UPI001CB167A5|nr:hypothetical protein [Capnocytophaga gingivalis]MBF1126168.1 hypothetical protein [Capnocytophaga sp.]